MLLHERYYIIDNSSLNWLTNHAQLASILQSLAEGSEVNRLISVHAVYKRSDTHAYPVNLLRNIALEQAATEYVLLLDVDFVPRPGLASSAISVIRSLPRDTVVCYSLHTCYLAVSKVPVLIFILAW